jgi:uncharacterized protein (DUF58 family)
MRLGAVKNIRGIKLRLKNPTLFVLTVALGLMALAFASSLFFYVFYVCLILVVASYLWVRVLAGQLTLAREMRSDWVQVGDQLRERFTLTNESRVGVLWVEIQDHSNVPDYEAGRVEAVGGRQYRKWGAQAVCTRRGLYTLGPVTIGLGDPFGLFQAHWDQTATRSFLVYPPLFDLPGLDLPRGAVEGASRTSLRSQQPTTNVATVRGYQPGDGLNRIHWPSTARVGSLMVKEFDLEPSGNLWIVLDLHRQWQAGKGDESTLEYAINVAASLAHKVLAENRAVGLVAYGAEPIVVQPEKGLRQLRRILEHLAVAQVGDYALPPLLSDLGASFGRGMTVAVVTPSSDPAWMVGLVDLARRGLTPAAVILDAKSFGSENDSAALLGELARFSIRAFLIRQGQRFSPLGTQRRRQEPGYRVLASGRVIRTSGE